MSYKSRYGHTPIRSGKFQNLSIGWDWNTSIDGKHFPVILFTPDMDNTNTHYHIELTKAQAVKLRNWLNTHLKVEAKRQKVKRK